MRSPVSGGAEGLSCAYTGARRTGRTMSVQGDENQPVKPLAGTCHHRWQKVDVPYETAQVCEKCKLFRYRVARGADWEYRAPIPRPEIEKR